MKKQLFRSGCKQLVLVTALMAAGAPVMAATYDGASREQVIVESPYTQKPNLGEPETRLLDRERVSYGVPVSIAGLDLKNPSDAATLRARVRNAAWDACQTLDRHFPESIYFPVGSASDRDCVMRAAKDGMAQAREIAEADTASSFER